MAYNESLAARVRQLLKPKRVQEKKMMGGLTFMVNGKMCVGILKDDLMARIDPNVYEAALERPGCRPMETDEGLCIYRARRNRGEIEILDRPGT